MSIQLALWQEDGEYDFSGVRATWHNGEWCFNIVDVIEALTGSNRARKYWDDLRRKLQKEGSQLSENIGQLKFKGPDGKYYKSDAATREQLLRIIQSIPSPKAEPFKLWLARKGEEHLSEREALLSENQKDYERMRSRGLDEYEAREWVITRKGGQKFRVHIADQWASRGAVGSDFGRLTNKVTEIAIGQTASEIKRELAISGTVRDHLSATENAAIGVTEYLSSIMHETHNSFGFVALSEDIEDTRPAIDAMRPELEKALSRKRPDGLPSGDEGRGLLSAA